MAAIAVAAGVRADIWAIPVPSLILLVRDPHQANGVSASEPYASAVHTESKPNSSATAICSSTPAGGPAPQYPATSASFTATLHSRLVAHPTYAPDDL